MGSKHNGSTPRAKSREERRTRHQQWMENEFRVLLVTARLSGSWSEVKEKAVANYMAQPVVKQIRDRGWIKNLLRGAPSVSP